MNTTTKAKTEGISINSNDVCIEIIGNTIRTMRFVEYPKYLIF